MFFCFDQQRRGVVLIGGDKSSHKDWYTVTINQAEKIFAEYLRNGFENEKG